MAIGKISRTAPKQIENFISGGGSQSNGAVQTEEAKPAEDDEVRMTFRCPRDLIDRLDAIRKSRPGNISRNQAIVEALDVFLKK